MDSHTYPRSQRPLIVAVFASIIALFVLWNLFLKEAETYFVQNAIVVLQGDSPVTGTVTFEQNSKAGPVKVTGQLKGLDPLAKRGFHIHSLGDLSNGCASTGSHFNPHEKNHGAPTDEARHIGDLGNVESDNHGVANIDFSDGFITLNGALSIIGRSVVVHAGTDDLGKGNNEESLKTGNAGGRAACGVIGLV